MPISGQIKKEMYVISKRRKSVEIKGDILAYRNF